MKSKKFYILSGAAVILLIGGLVFWNHFKYALVNKKLDQLVTGKSRGLYAVNYSNLMIDEAIGNISAENIELLPDSSVYQALTLEHKAPDDLFFIRIPVLQISGVKTPKALLNKEISAHIVRIKNADIEIRLGRKEKNKKTDFSQYLKGTYYRQILGNLNSINTDSVVLENAHLILRDKESKAIRAEVTGLSIRFAGTAIDSTSRDDSSRILFSKSISVQCSKMDLPDKNKLYDFHISALDYNSDAGTLHTDQIAIKPRLSETAFAKSNKYAKDRINMVIGSLDIKGINQDSILNEKWVLDTLKIRNASVYIFRDKSYPHDSVDRTHDYPQEAIMSMPLPIYFRRILIRDSYIEYKEKNDKSDSSGKVAFFKVQASIDNVTNIPEKIRQQRQMVLHFNSLFLNESAFTAKINMRLNDHQGHFQVDAQLAPIGAATLNPLLKPMALAELDRGRINKLVYHLDASNTRGTGTLDFLYEDLHVKLLKKDDDKNKYKTKLLPTLAAGLLLKPSNPLKGTTRIGHIDYTRDIHRSIFNMMWKSLFSGIKQIAL